MLYLSDIYYALVFCVDEFEIVRLEITWHFTINWYYLFHMIIELYDLKHITITEMLLRKK